MKICLLLLVFMFLYLDRAVLLMTIFDHDLIMFVKFLTVIVLVVLLHVYLLVYTSEHIPFK